MYKIEIINLQFAKGGLTLKRSTMEENKSEVCGLFCSACACFNEILWLKYDNRPCRLGQF